ncbi:MAG: TetR family transcriptional regulator [Proteobacteria bacterium]|nr:TetR family transcriptional regulator [Pseudomonadota bacterium]NIS68101.1 TetR family transcriptional regulator [Pseudomonadota bacterium]
MGTKDRKEREREARRGAILEAARPIFFQNGFQATTMDQIAGEAELSKGTLYLYFPSKDDLYATILLEGLERLHGMMIEACDENKDWETQLRDLGAAYYRFYLDHRPYFRILFLLQHGDLASRISESLYEKCFDEGLACLQILARVIQKGMESGEIEPRNPMELGVLSWGFLNGTFSLFEEEEHKRLIPISLDSLVRLSFDLITNGLRRRASWLA